MIVKDWIEWLQKQPPDNELILKDPDTEWLLPLRVQEDYPVGDIPPPKTTIVFASYYDRFEDAETQKSPA
jgi:hypothetical protein